MSGVGGKDRERRAQRHADRDAITLTQAHCKNEVRVTWPQIVSKVREKKKYKKQDVSEGQKDSQGRSLEY